MSGRYLIAAGANGARLPDLAADHELETVFDAVLCKVLAPRGSSYLSLGQQGVILGTLFHRHGPARPIAALDPTEIREIAASRGARLLSHYWGGYVALIADEDRPRLLRDPSGALPCFVARQDDHLFAASDVALLLGTAGVRTGIDWDMLALHLYGAGLPTFRTALAGIAELMPGFSLDPCASADQQVPCWLPWDHTAPAASAAEAAEHLRRTVIHAVRGWCSGLRRVVLSVSGGLDSSIIAACLANGGGPEVHCLTMFSDDAGGDEREHARSLCNFLGLPLTECRYRVKDVDIDAPLGAHLPRPFGRTQSNAYERAHLALAGALDADAFVTGNGGDNVFAYSQSAAAVADRLLAEGLGTGLLTTLRDVCRQTGCTIFEAVGSTARILRSPRTYRWRPSDSLLHPAVRARLADQALSHAWLEAPPGALPGKAGHIAGLLRVQHNLEPGRARFAPVLNPLLAQPVIETCLAIPSWRWREGGFDRAAARAAFRKDLPDSIAMRRSKGGPDGFTAQLIAHYRAAIRERLVEGHLAAHGIVDAEAIGRLLADVRPTLGEERTRLLTLLSAEAWLRFWMERLRTFNRRPTVRPL